MPLQLDIRDTVELTESELNDAYAAKATFKPTESSGSVSNSPILGLPHSLSQSPSFLLQLAQDQVLVRDMVVLGVSVASAPSLPARQRSSSSCNI